MHCSNAVPLSHLVWWHYYVPHLRCNVFFHQMENGLLHCNLCPLGGWLTRRVIAMMTTAARHHQDCGCNNAPVLVMMAGRDNDYYYRKDNSPIPTSKRREEEKKRKQCNCSHSLCDSAPRHDDDKQKPHQLPPLSWRSSLMIIDTVIVVNTMMTATIAMTKMMSWHCAQRHMLAYVVIVSSCSCWQI